MAVDQYGLSFGRAFDPGTFSKSDRPSAAINPPVEVAARLARKYAVEKTGLAPEDIGIIFISPCPSKVAYAKEPLGTAKSDIDGVLAIKDVYPMLLPLMVEAEKKPMDLSRAGRIGRRLGKSRR